jgi:hypothetical protein
MHLSEKAGEVVQTVQESAFFTLLACQLAAVTLGNQGWNWRSYLSIEQTFDMSGPGFDNNGYPV